MGAGRSAADEDIVTLGDSLRRVPAVQACLELIHRFAIARAQRTESRRTIAGCLLCTNVVEPVELGA